MSRIVQLLTGITVAAAASASLDCGTTTCSSCVGSGLGQVCVNYTATIQKPTCVPACTNALGGGDPLCSAATSTTTADASCKICVPVLLVGTCVTTNFGLAPYLDAQTTFDAGLDLSVFGGSTKTSAVTKIDSSTASGSISNNAVVVLSGSNAIANLNVDASASVIFQVNTSTTVNVWNSGAAAKVNNNNGGSLTVGSLSVSGKFSVWQDSAASVTLNTIDFSRSSASLQIAGGKAHVGTSGNANITGSGKLQLSGGVSIDGNVPSSVTIDVAASGSSAPIATVDTSLTLSISGDVTTSSNNGAIAVNGNFILGSATASVEPKVIVNNSATLVINAANKFQAKAVDLYAGATLVIGANVDRSQVYIEKIAKCVGTVQIKLVSTAAVFISANNATAAVGFKYSSSNNVDQLKQCTVQVVDSAGAKFTLTSTTTASAGRRLLASDGTATWGSDSMTFQMNKDQPSANSAFAPFAVAPLLMIGVAGLLF